MTILGILPAGSMKIYVTGVNWLKSGLEMLGIGFFIPGAGI